MDSTLALDQGATSSDNKRETNSMVVKDDNEEEDGVDLADSTPRQLSHIQLTVSAKFRLSTLIGFLVQCVQRQERVVVFMSTCDGVDFSPRTLSVHAVPFSKQTTATRFEYNQ
jgi:hypothetical protein